MARPRARMSREFLAGLVAASAALSGCVLVNAPVPEENSEDRLAGVIQGLSEVLSQTNVEKDERFGS